MFFKGRKNKRDLQQSQKMEESQRALLEAATATANAAHEVTTRLKERLDDSITRFEGTARILNDALILCDMNGLIQVVNPAAKRIFGNKLTGTNVTDLFDRSGSILNHAALWSMIEDETNWQPNAEAPLRGRRLNGELFWIRPSITRLDWSDKTSSLLLLIGDVTGIVQARSESRLAERRYRSIFESSFDGILVVQHGMIVAANPSIAVLFGYSAEELLGRPLPILFDPDDREKIEGDSKRHFAVTGITETGDILDLIYRATTIKWHDETARLITVKEVTDMKLLEELAKTRDNGVDMVVCFDRKFRITFANQSYARKVGALRAELLGKDIRDFVDPSERETFLNNIANLGVANPSCRVQVQVKGDAGYRVYDWIDHAIVDNNSEIIEYQRIGRDITGVVESLVSDR